MSARRALRNPASSVRYRLLVLARATNADYNLLVQRYTAERFLYRLSASPEVERFTLKGAALFRLWLGRDLRPTRDVDFLARGSGAHAEMRASMESICAVPCPEDGVLFDPETVEVEAIGRDLDFVGVRVRLRGHLDRMRLALQADIGFGDVVTPRPVKRDYPTLLDLPAPRLWTYPREAMIAEKFSAMVTRDATNTRVKDLWDIACLARRFEFDGETLRSAIRETFAQRGTAFERERPLALLPQYFRDPMRLQLWNKMLRQVGPEVDGPARLADVGDELERFLGPPWDALAAGHPFPRSWPAGGPWRPVDPRERGPQ